MLYADRSSKFVAVLNRTKPTPMLFNGVLHLAAGLVGRVTSQEREAMAFQEYEDGHGRWQATVSTFPFIVLEARSSIALRTLKKAADDGGLPCAAFAAQMLGASADAQRAAVAAAADDELEYIACCIWGPAAQVDPLCRRFSLYKERAAVALAPIA